MLTVQNIESENKQAAPQGTEDKEGKEEKQKDKGGEEEKKAEQTGDLGKIKETNLRKIKETLQLKEKAARGDKAEIPYHLWADQIQLRIPRVILPEDWENKVTPLRKIVLRWWKGE